MNHFDRSLKNKHVVFMDLDGTVYLGDKIISGPNLVETKHRERRKINKMIMLESLSNGIN